MRDAGRLPRILLTLLGIGPLLLSLGTLVALAPSKTPGAVAQPNARPRRRLSRLWLVPLLGAVAVPAWALGVEHMPPAAPVVMLAFGGTALALCGMALWRTLEPLLPDNDYRALIEQELQDRLARCDSENNAAES